MIVATPLDRPNDAIWQPGWATTAAWFVVGLAYLGALSWAFSSLVGIPLIVGATIIVFGAAFLMMVQLMLAERLYRRDPLQRFHISSIMMAMLWLSIHLAFLSTVWRAIKSFRGDHVVGPLEAGMLSGIGLYFIGFSTIILMLFSHSLLRIAVAVIKSPTAQRWFRRRHREEQIAAQPQEVSE